LRESRYFLLCGSRTGRALTLMGRAATPAAAISPCSLVDLVGMMSERRMNESAIQI